MANEKRLIDANALMKAIRSFRWVGPPNTLKLMFEYLRLIIRDEPTVDAVEVVHGRWIELPSMAPEHKCSECGQSYEWWEVSEAHYCPNCGAKMDGDGNGQA